MIRNVFVEPFPSDLLQEVFNRRNPSKNIPDELFPSLDDLLTDHSRLLHIFQHQHRQSDNYVINNLGECFTQVLNPETVERLSRAYGKLMFVQSRLKSRLTGLKSHPKIDEFLVNCERDPRTGRKKVSDCYLIIVQRWTKIETLLEAIVADTVALDGSQELSNLRSARCLIQSLIKGAEKLMMDLVHAEKLQNFADNIHGDPFVLRGGGGGDGDSRWQNVTLLQILRDPSTRLINTDIITLEMKKSGGKTQWIDVYGLALNGCFFLLQKHAETGKYHLFKDLEMPPVLLWSEHHGYFRDEAGSNFSFLLIIEEPMPSINRFKCATADEILRWKKVFRDGFAMWRRSDQSSLLRQRANIKRRTVGECDERWRRTEAILTRLRELDDALADDWRTRTAAFNAFFIEGQSHVPALCRTTSSSGAIRMTALTAGKANFRVSGEEEEKCAKAENLRLLQRRSKTESSQLNELDLESGAYLSDINLTEDFDRWLSSFQDAVSRLSFAIFGPLSAGLSRSASDTADRSDQSTVSNLRKYETFDQFDARLRKSGKFDNISTQKTEFKVKRDNRRFSSAFSSFLWPGVKEKRHHENANSNQLPSTGANRLSINAPSQPVHEDSASASQSCSSARTTSSSSLISLPSSDVLNLMDTVNEAAEKLCIYCYQHRTRMTELESKLSYFSEKNEILLNSGENVNALSTTTYGAANSELQGSVDPRHELEKLRERYDKFEADRKAWLAAVEKQRAQIERDNQKLLAAREKLSEDQKMYEEDCETLQHQIDLYVGTGIFIDNFKTTNLRVDESVGRVYAKQSVSASTIIEVSDEQTLPASSSISTDSHVDGNSSNHLDLSDNFAGTRVSQDASDRAEPINVGNFSRQSEMYSGGLWPKVASCGQIDKCGVNTGVSQLYQMKSFNENRPPTPSQVIRNPMSPGPVAKLPTRLASKSKVKSLSMKRSHFFKP